MSAHADRDRSERRELESYLAADKAEPVVDPNMAGLGYGVVGDFSAITAEPAPDADRVNAYAAKVAEVIPALRYIWKGDETARELIDALEVLIETEIAPNVIALADREQATLLAEIVRLRLRLTELRAERDEWRHADKKSCEWGQAQRTIREAAERALADERAKVARVEALVCEWTGDFLHTNCRKLIRAALAGPAEPEASEAQS